MATKIVASGLWAGEGSNQSIVLSDEPAANMDSKTGEEILDLMRRLNQEQHVTLLFATHDAKIVKHAKRVVSILDGRINEDQRVAA